MLDFVEAMDEAKQKPTGRGTKTGGNLHYVTNGLSLIFERDELLLRPLHVLYIRKPWKYKFKCSPPV